MPDATDSSAAPSTAPAQQVQEPAAKETAKKRIKARDIVPRCHECGEVASATASAQIVGSIFARNVCETIGRLPPAHMGVNCPFG